MALINAERIREILIDSLFNNDEVVNGELPESAVIANGVMLKIGFHKERLEKHRNEVKEILDNLPVSFKGPEFGGEGGDSFLNMCVDKNGEQWGEHKNMDELCVLSIALDLGIFMLPREIWSILPGNMPYFSIK